jgi:hypothetical protein
MARLTRDFSGKKSALAGRQAKGRAPAYATALIKRRTEGGRIGLLLVSVDDWKGGWYFEDKPNVARICAPEDFDIAAGDWGCVAGLDVLVCGCGPDERFNAAVLACLQAGAASVWGEFHSGIMRLEFWRWSAPYFIANECVPPEQFAARLASFRETAMLLQDGFYGHAAFQPARAALLERIGI